MGPVLGVGRGGAFVGLANGFVTEPDPHCVTQLQHEPLVEHVVLTDELELFDIVPFVIVPFDIVPFTDALPFTLQL